MQAFEIVSAWLHSIGLCLRIDTIHSLPIEQCRRSPQETPFDKVDPAARGMDFEQNRHRANTMCSTQLINFCVLSVLIQLIFEKFAVN